MCGGVWIVNVTNDAAESSSDVGVALVAEKKEAPGNLFSLFLFALLFNRSLKMRRNFCKKKQEIAHPLF